MKFKIDDRVMVFNFLTEEGKNNLPFLYEFKDELGEKGTITNIYDDDFLNIELKMDNGRIALYNDGELEKIGDVQ